MSEDADTIVILSSELIAEVMEVHFNKVMFKQRVKVVDLKPTETGYMFSITFASIEKKVEPKVLKKFIEIPQSAKEMWNEMIKEQNSVVDRDNKGRFTSMKIKERNNG